MTLEQGFVNEVSNNTAIAYYRTATTDTKGIENQRNKVKQYASENGITIVEEYQDENKSGMSNERPEYLRMLSEIRNIGPSYLIVSDPARLTRDRSESLRIKSMMKATGVQIVYASGDIPDNDDETRTMLKAICDAINVKCVI